MRSWLGHPYHKKSISPLLVRLMELQKKKNDLVGINLHNGEANDMDDNE